jgi:4-amino-4-deoxy-L-arabinose transferase-like glycosyltransferase
VRNTLAKSEQTSKLKRYWPLVAIVALIFLLRLPSFFEPHWYYDEGVYALFGRSIIEGETPYLYIWDNKLLGLYLIYALAYLFPFDILLAAKIFAFLSVIASTILVFLIAKQGFSQKIASISAMFFAIFSSLPFFEGNQANGEVLFVTPVLLAIYLINPFTRDINLKKLFLAGILLGVAGAIKQVAMVDLPLAILLLYIKEGKIFSKTYLFVVGGFALSIGSVVLLALALGTPLSTLWFSTVVFNFAFTVNTKVGVLFSFLKIAVAALILLALSQKNKIVFLPLIIWLLVDSIGVLTGGKPYPHYLIQILPVSSIILAIWLFSKKSSRILSSLGLLISALFILLVVNAQFRVISYGDVLKEWSYYPSFVRTAVTGDESFKNVFDQRWGLERNEKVVSYLNKISEPSNRVYIWGGGTTSWLYYDLDRKLPTRYTSFLNHEAIESADEEVITDLRDTKPLFIIITPRPTFPALTAFIDENYERDNVIDDVTIYRLEN